MHDIYSSAVTTRPFRGCTGRAFLPSSVICIPRSRDCRCSRSAVDTSTGFFTTHQSTISLQPGVVRLPA
ncbi:hypothetical protein PC120_g26649 [Phytophthora cactorum]|nr:hypothetical protein PC120_g26649 [Phytophthora cactorum]